MVEGLVNDKFVLKRLHVIFHRFRVTQIVNLYGELVSVLVGGELTDSLTSFAQRPSTDVVFYLRLFHYDFKISDLIIY